MKKGITYILFFSITTVFNCVEELDVITIVENDYEDVLVVEATITDELKTQVILLSRAYGLGNDGPLPESNAQIQVISDNGDVYVFQEVESGRYESVTTFAALNAIEYNLEIITSDNLKFESSKSTLSGTSNIANLSLERDFNENNEEGISIYVDGSDPTGKAEFYRYTYEETYKIIAPKYSALDLKYEIIYEDEDPNDNIPPIPRLIEYFLVPKEEQQQICFNTALSNDIILTSTTGLSVDDVEMFRVRFLNRLNPIITHRYSVLVSQFVQSEEAFRFYETLSDFSESADLLSEVQQGFVSGNLFSTSNQDLKVAGFFEVSSVDKRRIYFNYEDLFPDEELPPYFESCPVFAPFEQFPGSFPTFPLAIALDQGNKYFQPNEDPVIDGPFQGREGPYDLVSPICGNCTVMGNNYPPDFWEE